MPDWTKTTPALAWFNGCRATMNLGNVEYGLFHERHGRYRWNIRVRPLGGDGQPRDCWGLPVVEDTTKRDVLSRFRVVEGPPPD
jgi:hypothetical protein